MNENSESVFYVIAIRRDDEMQENVLKYLKKKSKLSDILIRRVSHADPIDSKTILNKVFGEVLV
jgi:hypothetical protein